ADITIGSREGTGAARLDEPVYRHYLGRLFNILVQAGALSGIEDSQCASKMFSRQAAGLVFPLATLDGWAFDVVALTIARRHAFRMLRDVLRIRQRAATGRYDRPS